MSDSTNPTNDTTFVKIVINEDGYEMRMDRPDIKWPERARAYDPEMGKLIKKHLKVLAFWAARWENGDPMAINHYRKNDAHHNGVQWDFHTKGVIGKGTDAKVSKEAMKELIFKELAAGNVKIASETADLYVKKLTNAECQKFLMEAFTNKDLEPVKDEIITMITDRVQDLMVKKAEKNS